MESSNAKAGASDASDANTGKGKGKGNESNGIAAVHECQDYTPKKGRSLSGHPAPGNPAGRSTKPTYSFDFVPMDVDDEKK